ncbi:MAG: hypothetical protein R2822_17375 [Spirosomataceae bacterium]
MQFEIQEPSLTMRRLPSGILGLFGHKTAFLNFSGSFTNNATGIISIEKTWGNGIWNSSGTFQNDGKITVSNVFDSS